MSRALPARCASLLPRLGRAPSQRSALGVMRLSLELTRADDPGRCRWNAPFADQLIVVFA